MAEQNLSKIDLLEQRVSQLLAERQRLAEENQQLRLSKAKLHQRVTSILNKLKEIEQCQE